MESLNAFLEHRVRKLIERYSMSKGDALPVDLGEVARDSGVLSIEDREMIPEAVLSPESAGFRIYLQSNFIEGPKMHLRRRFSIAHEIAHTLFYEPRDGILKPVRNAPRGDKLETACHQGARLLLVPQQFLVRELRRIGIPIGVEKIVELSRKFEVSVEVMLRRLNETGIFESTETALLLVHGLRKQEATIEFAVYPPWLKVLLPKPSRKAAFASWLRCSSPELRLAEFGVQGGSDRDVDVLFGKGLLRQTNLGTLRVSPFNISTSQYIFEFRIEELMTPRFADPCALGSTRGRS